MSIYIKPAYQVQRINELENRLEAIRHNAFDDMVKRPHPKSWSPIEVAMHMVIGHNEYKDKLNQTLLKEVESNYIASEYKASIVSSFLIKRFPPQKGQIRYKMKTTKKFKPVLDLTNLDSEDVERVLTELEDILIQLKLWINTYRTKAISLKKFNSALGPLVRFTAPEACEFILCHNERHFLQLERAMAN